MKYSTILAFVVLNPFQKTDCSRVTWYSSRFISELILLTSPKMLSKFYHVLPALFGVFCLINRNYRKGCL